MHLNKVVKYISVLLLLLNFGCNNAKKQKKTNISDSFLNFSKNILDYRITPKDSVDKSGLMFSDQGAWFAYGFHKEPNESIGFSGPFLMTQQNGVWLSTSLMNAMIKVDNNFESLKNGEGYSYSSHLENNYSGDKIEVSEKLVFKNGHTALLQTKIKNIGDKNIDLELLWGHSPILISGISLSQNDNTINIISTKTNAKGYLTFPKNLRVQLIDSLEYKANVSLDLKPNETKEIVVSHTFIFPEYSWEEEKKQIQNINFDSVLNARKQEKNKQLKSIIENRKPQFEADKYGEVLAKAHLTLQNNWRIPAGEIKHEGLFPSYHYKWFNGFWAWDSWKHAVGLSYYNNEVAKNQMWAMFDFQKEDGFIVDCIFRDTTIEAHNYRDTKPPLAAWAVAKIYEKDKDIGFVKAFYPKLKLYHNWWYNKRDHDQDGLCEYGSTDGTLIAAKWESGMDNAIRFDDAKILKNSEGAYSLNQESVDLNAYLYAEKLYLSQLAKVIHNLDDTKKYKEEAKLLKDKIQQQFYDKEDGWFYDTNLEGTTFIKGEGSEGWTALWANAATQEQANAVKNKMMNPEKFYTKVPFQTMSADHERFDPLEGYWRGPNWLDQAYFGVKGLRNYGFHAEADQATIQIIKGAEGILGKGQSIRENYHPLTGEGLNAQNFSWSAAHLIMLLQND
ncbi:MGH1-like glycoside hydrolase domain-containing protein [Hwangdonia lutea]|uniref:Trehalase family glycosidase n=1 Tax=Hwangdonia lutea TaxID=3075823 RepID=A0AA97EMI5_9FLAO|nr:trehalase family glycosidase [Hwangdonia sp. SCSIO 19198]WOD44156.1 trehalase family glycosidase [Hwangdonia sp. SCSIO 19198]